MHEQSVAAHLSTKCLKLHSVIRAIGCNAGICVHCTVQHCLRVSQACIAATVPPPPQLQPGKPTMHGPLSNSSVHQQAMKPVVGVAALQVLLSTAQWLASSQGFDAHGTSLTIKELDNPKTCIYYAAAYLSVLSHHGGSARSEGFVVRAYHAGPKGVYTATACTYLQKYLKAKHWLTEVAKAMAVTVAAAALAVQVPLPAAAAAGGSGNAGSVCMAVQGKVFLPTSPDSKTDQACKDQNSSSSDSSHEADSTVSKDLTTLSSDSATASTSTSKKQVMVRRATADLLTALCSSWDDLNQATGKAPPAAAGSGLGAGSILAHMLPSRWGLSSSRQQQTAHDTSGEGPLALVSVIAADLQTAWQRLLCISASGARLALGHATAAAALAPLSSGERETGAASAADAAGDSGAPPAAAAPAGAVDSTRRSSNESSRSAARSPSRLASISAAAGQKHLAGSSAPAAAAGAQVVDCMPCVIHVVGSGETLQRIAAVCNLNMTDLLAANPEVTEADAVRHNDCIAVPVPAVFPRLYVVQPGDTLHSIARAHEVPMGRLLAKNPELIDPSRVQPGWVVALPGLKGDSRVALPADWLTQAPLTVEAQQQQAYSAALGGDGQLQACTPDLWQQQQQRGGSKQDAQQGLIATTSFPSYSPRQTRSRQHRARHKQGSGASEGLGITLSDPGNGKRQQQEQQLLSVGSGAFLFTVGSNNSLAATPSTSSDGTSSWTMSGNQQSSRKPRPAKQSSSAKGTSIDSAAVASHSLDVSHGWAVGAEAGMAH